MNVFCLSSQYICFLLEVSVFNNYILAYEIKIKQLNGFSSNKFKGQRKTLLLQLKTTLYCLANSNPFSSDNIVDKKHYILEAV